MGHVESKTRSQGQILEKPRVCSRSQIFNLTLGKLGQIVCLNEIVEEFETGHVGTKTRSNLRKTLCIHLRPHFQSNTHETWSQCLHH